MQRAEAAAKRRSLQLFEIACGFQWEIGFQILAKRRAQDKVGVDLSHSCKAINRVSIFFMD